MIAKRISFSFASSSAAAQSAILSFNPQGAVLVWNGRSEAGDAQGQGAHRRGAGFWTATGPTRQAGHGASNHNANPSAAKGQSANDAAFVFVDSGGAEQGRATISVTDNLDGTWTVTLTPGAAFGEAIRVDATWLSDMTFAVGGQVNTTSPSFALTGMPGTPDVVLFLSGTITANSTVGSDSSWMIGAATRSPLSHGVLVGGANDGVSPAQAIRYHNNIECIASPNSGASLSTHRGRVTAWNADGVTVTMDEGQGQRIAYMALGGVDARILSAATAMDTVSDITLTAGFRPSALLAFGHGAALDAVDTPRDHDQTIVGLCDSQLSQSAFGVLDQDALSPTLVSTAIRGGDIYVRQSTGATPAVAGAMRVSEITETGAVLRMSVAEDSARPVSVLLLGPDSSLPGAPSSVTSTALGSTRATLEAVDGAENETETRFYRAPDAEGAPDAESVVLVATVAVVDGPGTGGDIDATDNDAAGGPWWYGAAHANGYGESAIIWAAGAVTMPPAPSGLITSPAGDVTVPAGTKIACEATAENYTTAGWYRGYPGLGGLLLSSALSFTLDTTGQDSFPLIFRAVNDAGEAGFDSLNVNIGSAAVGGGAEVLAAMQTLYLHDPDAERRRVFLMITKNGIPIPGLTGRPQLTLRDGTAAQTSATLTEVDAVANPGFYYVQLTQAEIVAEGTGAINYWDGSGNRGITLVNIEAFPPPSVGLVLGYTNATAISLPTGLGIKAGWTLAIVNGSGVGQVAIVNSYTSGTGATVIEGPGFATALDGSSKFAAWASPVGMDSTVIAAATKAAIEASGSTLAEILADTAAMQPRVENIDNRLPASPASVEDLPTPPDNNGIAAAQGAAEALEARLTEARAAKLDRNLAAVSDLPAEPDNAGIAAAAAAASSAATDAAALEARASELRLAKLDRDLVAVGGEVTLSDAAEAAVAGAAAAAVGGYRAKGTDASLSEAIRLLKAWTYGKASGADGDAATLVFEDPDEPGVVRLTIAVDADGNRAVSGDANLA